jgi:hypothetical protein
VGCHTWFYRRTTARDIITSDYVKELKEYLEEGEELPFVSELFLYPDFNLFYSPHFRLIPRKRNPKWRHRPWLISFNYLTHCLYYEQVHDFHDTFRIKNYPDKKIHNFRQLRRFLGKRYYSLTQAQIDRVKEFWSKYPNGMIEFG